MTGDSLSGLCPGPEQGPTSKWGTRRPGGVQPGGAGRPSKVTRRISRANEPKPEEGRARQRAFRSGQRQEGSGLGALVPLAPKSNLEGSRLLPC